MKNLESRSFRSAITFLVVCAVAGFVALAVLTAPPVFAANPGMDLWDCANGLSGAVGGCDIVQSGNSHGWNNTGNIGNSSHYSYGQTVPWRIVFTDLPSGAHTVVVTYTYSFVTSSAYNWDYMTNWYRTVFTVTADDPCVGTLLSGACTQSSLIALPQDPSTVAGTCPAAPQGNTWSKPPGIMQGFGGITINSIAYNGTHACTGTIDASVSVTFTTSGGANALLIFGLNVGDPQYWVTVPGPTVSSYHVALGTFSIDGVQASPCSGCNKQLQMKVQASPTAVTLSKFGMLDVVPANVTLGWDTASEVNTAGFNVYRAESMNGPYSQINAQLIPSKADKVAGGKYQYLDKSVVPGKTYFYQLEDVELGGAVKRHDPITVNVPADSLFDSTPVRVGAIVGGLLVVVGGLFISLKKLNVF